MAIKELNTRIALKYDDYQKWLTSDLELLPGELAIAYLGETKTPDLYKEGTQAQKGTHPVLFKVGPGKFKDLPWASALAADVYAWAKAKTVTYNSTDKKIEFKNEADTVIDSIDLSTLATKDVTDGLNTRLGIVETSIATGGALESRVAATETAITTINGDGTGSIKAAADAAQAAAIAEAATDATTKADAAEAAAIAEATRLDGLMNTRVSALETAKGSHDTEIAGIKTSIAGMDTAYKAADAGLKSGYEAADKAIEDKIGGNFTSTDTVAKAITDAIDTAATTAQNKVDALKNDEVKANADKISEHTTAIAGLQTAITDEASARTNKDDELEERIKSMEVFFEAADHDGKPGGLTDALDTLKEIQDYLNGEAETGGEDAVGGIIGRVAANEKAIENLGKADETLTDNLNIANTNISNLTTAVTTLNEIVEGYSNKGDIADAISGVDTKAGNAANAAAEADRKAVVAQSAADDAAQAATAAQGTADEALGKANKNITDLGSLTTRVGAAETEIDAIQAIVSDAAENDTVGKLRTDVNALKTLTGDAAKGNEALYTKLTRVAGLVDDETTGLAATKAVADDALDKAEANKTEIENIKTDLTDNVVHEADELILSCGNSSLVAYTKPNA